MLYGNNILPTRAQDWILNSATYANGTVTLQAGGSAMVTLTAAEGSNETPIGFLVEARASSYGDVYNPPAQIYLEVTYEDNSTYCTMVPVINQANGLLVPVTINPDPVENIVPFISLRYTIRSSVAVTFPMVALRKATTEIAIAGKNYYGMSFSQAEGMKITRTDGLGQVLMNGDTFAMQAKVGQSWQNRVYFDPLVGQGEYIFVGNLNVNGGTLNINDRFVVDAMGNVTMAGDTQLSGPTKIYSGEFYAGTPSSYTGYSKMTPTGYEIVTADGSRKIRLGYTDNQQDYPYVAIGAGDGSPNSVGLVKKFLNGLWIGNSAPEKDNGTFAAKSGYNGIFFSFAENAAYVVHNTDMKNIYTGDAIAKFG